jgi:hypothetical protein
MVDLDLEAISTLLREAGATGDAWRTTPHDDREVVTQTEHCSEAHVATAYAAGEPDKALARGRLIAAAPRALTALVTEVEELRAGKAELNEHFHAELLRADTLEAEVERLREAGQRVLDAVDKPASPVGHLAFDRLDAALTRLRSALHHQEKVR